MPNSWAFTAGPTSSFSEVLRLSQLQSGEAPRQLGTDVTVPDHVEGTTIVALTFADGVVIAGDRRATAGHLIARRDIRKIFQTDRVSAMGIAGSAGPAIELANVFATELEHYEKVEGRSLSLEGKANKLATMVRAHLPLAMQGLVVVPLFAGFDVRRNVGRIFDFDAVGGRYEELRFSATGSGSVHGKASLKGIWREGLSRDDAVDAAVRALWDAADEDAGTGGPDPVRGIYPIVAVISGDGYREVSTEQVRERTRVVAEGRGKQFATPRASEDTSMTRDFAEGLGTGES